MTDTIITLRKRARQPIAAPSAVAVILGTDELASAVAVYLRRAGWQVVLSHTPHPPVLRRRMAFYDVLFGDAVEVDGIKGVRVGCSLDVRAAMQQPGEVVVTPLDILDLLVIGRLDLLIDARMQTDHVKPDLRWIAGVSIGIGPGFDAGRNCDIAIGIDPAKAGIGPQVDDTPGLDRREAGFVCAQRAGTWRSAVEIGAHIFKDFILGHLDGDPVHAPAAGLVRGMVRDGLSVPAGARLFEITPRRRNANWHGIERAAATVGKATITAIDAHVRRPAFSG